MLIFNTTYLVDSQKISLWLEWVKNVHIPFMLKTGKFSAPQIAKVLYSDSANGESFSVQFKVKDMDALGVWSELYAEKFQNDVTEQFGAEVLPFSTVLEILE